MHFRKALISSCPSLTAEHCQLCTRGCWQVSHPLLLFFNSPSLFSFSCGLSGMARSHIGLCAQRTSRLFGFLQALKRVTVPVLWLPFPLLKCRQYFRSVASAESQALLSLFGSFSRESFMLSAIACQIRLLMIACLCFRLRPAAGQDCVEQSQEWILMFDSKTIHELSFWTFACSLVPCPAAALPTWLCSCGMRTKWSVRTCQRSSGNEGPRGEHAHGGQEQNELLRSAGFVAGPVRYPRSEPPYQVESSHERQVFNTRPKVLVSVN